MKFIKHIYILFIIPFLVVSCSTTRDISIATIAPSPVDFSSQIKKIGIINASQRGEMDIFSNRLEQLIAMEEKWLEEKGTDAALTGLFNELVQDKRFVSIQILKNLPDQVPAFNSVPTEEAWESIANLCAKNNVDAIFALASHKTNTAFKLRKTKVDDTGMMREKFKVKGKEITLKTLIENGWRVYDPYQKLVIDDFTSNEEIVSSAKGVNSLAALKAIDNRRKLLFDKSKQSGSNYGLRMQPQEIEIVRKFYKNENQNFKLADQSILNNDIPRAYELLETEATSLSPKVKGKACFNLAVLNEYNGKLNEALSWALKSYEIKKNKKTKSYISSLEEHIKRNALAQEQLILSSTAENK